MNDKPVHTEPPFEEVDFMEYLEVIFRYRKMIVRNVCVAAIAMALISFLLPRQYTAESSLLPPDDTQSGGLFSSTAAMPFAQLGLMPVSSTADLFVQIMQSRSVIDRVLDLSFHAANGDTVPLMKLLDAESPADGRRKLRDRMAVSASKEGVIRVRVEMPDPIVAAEVTNALVRSLDIVNQQKYTTRAKNSRLYIEEQLRLTEEKLKAATDSLTTFKERYKAVALEDQTKTAIEQAGELKGKIIAKEVELGVALQTMKADNVYVVTLQKEIDELKKQYDKLQFGDTNVLSDTSEFYVPFATIPMVARQLSMLTRNVKVQETVWELLNRQYYQAKIQEARDTPTVQVLDEAIPPEIPSRPKKKLLVLVAVFLSFLGSVFWAFVRAYVDRLKAQDQLPPFWQQTKDDMRMLRQAVVKHARRVWK